ncbi:MAG: T9SS type A sorting domain-containing protein [Sphingobacteriales bacterium]|nr:MAG: T9SS type A sorting domain-containing protein [Sphingobacteriales bacterium]
MKQTTIAQTAKQLTPTETSLVQTIAQSNTKAAFEAQCIRYLTHGEEYQIQLPPLPDLNGFSEGTGVGDGSPEDLADDIRNNSVSDNELSVRTTQAVQYYLQQDSTQQEAIDFLTELDTHEAKTMLLGAYLQQSDTAMVRHYRLLLNADTVVNPNLKDYYKMLDDVVKDGRSLYDLTEHESSDFESLMGSDNSTDTYIQSLLAMPRLQTYNRIPQPVNESNKRPNQVSQSKNASWLYPNPATNTINIASNLQWKTATLYNLLGKILAGYTSENNSLSLPENLQNGIYIVQLTLENGQTQTAKLFISK